MSITERIPELLDAGRQAIAAATTSAELENVRINYLGRKAELPNLLRSVAELPPDQRGAAGRAANEARKSLEAEIETKANLLAVAELDARLVDDRVDVTLPADPAPTLGHLHLITQTRREIEDVFIGLGYRIADGPEVERVHYNFNALNFTDTHPSRMLTDTFYIEPPRGTEDAEGGDTVGMPGRGGEIGAVGIDVLDPQTQLLRVHTSPTQVRSMEAQGPPIYVIAPGRVYRPDSDATHTPQFHQIEGLAIDEGITLADLKGTLLTFARAIFGPDREVRLRPHFFPFTEPSVEVDVSCFNCTDGVMANGHRCNLCKGTGWIEILGSGMVDPNVLAGVPGGTYDPEKVQGFAFGMGIERIAMLKHGVSDLRLFYDNDIRFLEQF